MFRDQVGKRPEESKATEESKDRSLESECHGKAPLLGDREAPWYLEVSLGGSKGKGKKEAAEGKRHDITYKIKD